MNDPPPRFATLGDPTAQSYGPSWTTVLECLEKREAMPWQRRVLTVAGELRPDGLPRFRTVVVTIPRQGGKNAILRSLASERALRPLRHGGRLQTVMHVAQAHRDGKSQFERYVVMTKAAPGLRRLVDRYRFAAGSEGIDFQGGGRYRMIAPTQEAGHGETVDLALVDEAWSPRAFGDFHVLQALTPAMATREDAQLWIFSTAGKEGSTVLRHFVDLGRAAVAVGDDDGLAYFEWSAPSDVDLDDRAVWAAAHPALGNTISEDVLVQARRDLPAEEFARAFLNIWPEESTNDDLTVDGWDACHQAGSSLGGSLALGIDIAFDRSSASIVGCGTWGDDGWRHHVELIDRQPGVDWLVPRLAELIERHDDIGSIAWDDKGPVASLAPDLEPVVGALKKTVGTRELIAASGRLVDEVNRQRVVHLAQPPLRAAIEGLKRRKVGDMWFPDRSRSTTDVSPLIAGIVALWTHASLPVAAVF